MALNDDRYEDEDDDDEDDEDEDEEDDEERVMMMCSAGCDEEEQCSLVDVRQDDSELFHSCLLFPDSTVCGAYDKKLRDPCRPLLARRPTSAHKKRGESVSSRYIYIQGGQQTFLPECQTPTSLGEPIPRIQQRWLG